MKKRSQTDILVSQVYRDPHYKGKHIVIIGGKIFSTKTGMAQVKLLEKLMKNYPKETPTIVYVPREDSLILLL